jgi:TetR/AcrR family transcriptional regulator, regulator of autoinduction and epiphytic fitness
MTPDAKSKKRGYHAPLREAAARRTQESVLQAAKRVFETRGWAGATIGAIADSAGVSPKTVEAIFGTKPALLEQVVGYSIAGDTEPVAMPMRDAVLEMERVSDAATMLDLHAAHLRRINTRSARIALVVEHTAPSEPAVAVLWKQMNDNRAFGVRWATTTLLTKPRTRHLAAVDVERTFWVALDWATYRVLTEQAGLTADEFEAWVANYYRKMLLRE